MLIHKNDIETITKFAGVNDCRHVLNGVLIEADGTLVATDGHILGVLKPQATPESEFPVLKGLEAVDEKVPLAPCILPTEPLLKVAKQLKGSKNFPILANAQIDNAETNKNGQAFIRVTDLENQQVMSVTKVEGKFPDYRQVMPKPDACVYRTSFDAELLIRAMQAAVKHCGKGKAVVEFEFGANGLGATRAVVANSEAQTLEMVIMPCRTNRKAEEFGVIKPVKAKKGQGIGGPMATLRQCILLRCFGYRPHALATCDGRTLELISYPFPEPDGAYIMARELGDPTTMQQYRIPDEGLDLAGMLS